MRFSNAFVAVALMGLMAMAAAADLAPKDPKATTQEANAAEGYDSYKYDDKYGYDKYGKYDDKYGKYDDKYGYDKYGKYDDKYGKYDDKYGKYDDKYGKYDDKNGYDKYDDKYGHYPSIPAPSVTDVSPNGQTYSELAQIFWQWIVRYNQTYSPLAASNPADCNLGIVAGGDVLVIGGVVGALGDNYRTTRNCFLTKGIKSIFIPLLNSEEDTDGDLQDLQNPGGFLRPDSFANGQFRDLTGSVFLRVFSDGREVHIPGWPHSVEHQTQFIKDNYYVATPYFSLVPPRFTPDTFEPRVLLAAATGYHVMLDVEHVHFPLTLQFGGQLVQGGTPLFTLDITYNINGPQTGYRREPDRGGY